MYVQGGDEALHKYNERFDACKRTCLRVSREEIEEAYDQMTDQELLDLKEAKANIEGFAAAQRGTVTELKTIRRSPASIWDTESFRCPPAAAMFLGAAIPSTLQL